MRARARAEATAVHGVVRCGRGDREWTQQNSTQSRLSGEATWSLYSRWFLAYVPPPWAEWTVTKARHVPFSRWQGLGHEIRHRAGGGQHRRPLPDGRQGRLTRQCVGTCLPRQQYSRKAVGGHQQNHGPRLGAQAAAPTAGPTVVATRLQKGTLPCNSEQRVLLLMDRNGGDQG